MKKFIASLAIAIALISPSVAQAADVQSIGYTNVRSGPSVSSPVIGWMKPTQVLPLVTTGKYWNTVTFNGQPAYVSALSKYTTIVNNEPVVSKADQIIAFGKTFMGTPYLFGGKTPAAFDCSGFTRYVYGQFGIKLPAGSYNQTNYGTLVAKADLQPGDLIFTDTDRDGDVNHVSIYIGNDQVLHTYKVGVGVTISKYSGSRWDTTFVNARRVL